MTGTIPVPVLADGVVTLRAHRQGDAEDLITTCTDAETIRCTTVPVPYGEHEAQAWITDVAPGGWRDGTGWSWAIEVAGRFAGNIAIRARQVPDIGYMVAPWARGRGVATRAVRLATRWAFEHGGLPIVHWTAVAGNLASWRVAHACGFTFQCERLLALDHRGVLVDIWTATLRPADPPKPRTTWWDTPVIDGERVRLRPHTEADLPRIVEANQDPRRRHWILGLPDPYTEEHARAYLRRGELEAALGQRIAWTVADRATDRLLGNISIFDLGRAVAPTGGEVGYWAHPDARGRGVTTEAVRLVVRHAFTPVAEGGLGRTRLQIGASWGNTASRHVAEAAGFTLVGHFHREELVGDGTLDDGAWYELLKE